MIYDTSNQGKAVEAIKRLQDLIDKGSLVEIKRKNKPKSLNQNSYLYKIMSLASIHFGYNLEEMKQVFKGSWVKHGVLAGVKTDPLTGIQIFKSIARMDKEDVRMFTDHVRDFSQAHDCYLPSAKEYELKRIYFDNEIEKQNRYL